MATRTLTTAATAARREPNPWAHWTRMSGSLSRTGDDNTRAWMARLATPSATATEHRIKFLAARFVHEDRAEAIADAAQEKSQVFLYPPDTPPRPADAEERRRHHRQYWAGQRSEPSPELAACAEQCEEARDATQAELLALEADTFAGAMLKFGAGWYFASDPWGEAFTHSDPCAEHAFEDLCRLGAAA